MHYLFELSPKVASQEIGTRYLKDIVQDDPQLLGRPWGEVLTTQFINARSSAPIGYPLHFESTYYKNTLPIYDRKLPRWGTRLEKLNHIKDVILYGGIAGSYHFKYTLLHAFSAHGNEAAVKLLIKRGANVNERGPFAWTPLHVAAKHGNDTMIRFLVEIGATLEAQDAFGQTPLFTAVVYGHEAAVRLLLEIGADIKAHKVISQPPEDPGILYAAIANKHPGLVPVLVESGAKIYFMPSSAIRTALHAAVDGGEPFLSAIDLLLQKGARVNCADSHGNTPLHDAIDRENSSLAIVRLLLQYGSPTSLENKAGLTALDCAEKWGHTEIVKLLNETKEPRNSEPYTEKASSSRDWRSLKRRQSLVKSRKHQTSKSHGLID